MKKGMWFALSALLGLSLAACGNSSNRTNTESVGTSAVSSSSDASDYELGEDEQSRVVVRNGNPVITDAEFTKLEDDDSASVSAASSDDPDDHTENEGSSSVEASGDIAPMVCIDGALYSDTGYVSSAAGCGNMDGEITSSVDESEWPAENDQSNFGTGYGYQIAGDGLVLVYMDGQMEIFRALHSDSIAIPKQVASFIAKVEEDRDETLLVSYEGMPDDAICAPPENGLPCEYVVSTKNADSSIRAGDNVIIWYTGSIEETDPARIEAYQISKYVDNTADAVTD